MTETKGTVVPEPMVTELAAMTDANMVRSDSVERVKGISAQDSVRYSAWKFAACA